MRILSQYSIETPKPKTKTPEALKEAPKNPKTPNLDRTTDAQIQTLSPKSAVLNDFAEPYRHDKGSSLN